MPLSLSLSLALSPFLSLSLRFDLFGDIQLGQSQSSMAGSSDAANGAVDNISDVLARRLGATLGRDEELVLMAPWFAVIGCIVSFLMCTCFL